MLHAQLFIETFCQNICSQPRTLICNKYEVIAGTASEFRFEVTLSYRAKNARLSIIILSKDRVNTESLIHNDCYQLQWHFRQVALTEVL